MYWQRGAHPRACVARARLADVSTETRRAGGSRSLPHEVQRTAMPRSREGMRLDGFPGERSGRKGDVCRTRSTMAGVGATKGRPRTASTKFALTHSLPHPRADRSECENDNFLSPQAGSSDPNVLSLGYRLAEDWKVALGPHCYGRGRISPESEALCFAFSNRLQRNPT